MPVAVAVALVPALAIAAASPWAAPYLDDAAAAKVEHGEIVRTHSLEHGVIRYMMAARIDATPAAVLGAVRDVCASIKHGDDAPKLTFLLAPGVDAFLARDKHDIGDPALHALPATDCRRAGELSRYFVLADSPGKFPFPASRSLMRIEARVDDAALFVKTTQVLGGIGGSTFSGESEYLPMPDGNVGFVERGSFTLPSLMPDFLVQKMLDQPEDKDPQLLHLADLRARAKKRLEPR